MTLDQEMELAALLGVSEEHVQRLHKRKRCVAEIDRIGNPPVIIAR